MTFTCSFFTFNLSLNQPFFHRKRQLCEKIPYFEDCKLSRRSAREMRNGYVGNYKKKKGVSLLMRQLFTTDQMTQKLITIGHHTVFNNEHILAYTDCLFSTYFNKDFFNC